MNHFPYRHRSLTLVTGFLALVSVPAAAQKPTWVPVA